MDDLNMQDIIDVRDIIARFEELENQIKPRFVAGWNMPGYLPDSEPAEFDDSDDAMEYVKDAAKREVDAQENDIDDTNADAMESEIDGWEADSSGEFGHTFGKYHYFVTLDGEMGLDDDERKEFDQIKDLLADLCGNGGDEQWRGDWYPVTLIRDTYFNDYMDEMLEACGELPKDLPCYLSIKVDYRALQMDYTSCEIDGITYWYR